MKTSSHRIAAIAGDGIGTEVMPEGLRVLEAAASRFDIDLTIDHFDFASWNWYEKHGSMMPDDWKAQIQHNDAHRQTSQMPHRRKPRPLLRPKQRIGRPPASPRPQ